MLEIQGRYFQNGLKPRVTLKFGLQRKPPKFFLSTQYIYRVSIKSFPDYKHLLQENYVEYKHTCFLNVSQLKKFFYN
jgi:hypothetical protein